MKYEHLPRQDRVALEWYIDCLKEISSINIDYEIYEGSSWYIIYLEDHVFDVLEDKIDEILYYNHRLLTIDKEILFAPKRFMVSYEEKIEGQPNMTYHEDIEMKPYFHHYHIFNFGYKIQDSGNMNTPNDSIEKHKTKKEQQGVINEQHKAA